MKHVCTWNTSAHGHVEHMRANTRGHAHERHALHVPNARAQVRQSKKTAHNLREQQALRSANANALIAQTKSVALLEKLLTRHSAARNAMWGVYTQVCLQYEVEGLMTIENKYRDSDQCQYLTEAQQTVEEAQYEAEKHARVVIDRADKHGKDPNSAAAGSKAISFTRSATTAAPLSKAAASPAKGPGRASSAVAMSALDAFGIGKVESSEPKKSADIQTIEEAHQAAMKVGPDGLARVDMLAALAANKDSFVSAQLAAARIHKEVETWQRMISHVQRLREQQANGGSASEDTLSQIAILPDGQLDVAHLKEMKESRAGTVLESNRAVFESNAKEARLRGSATRMQVLSGGERRTLEVATCKSLIKGAEAQLELASGSAPESQLVGQREMWLLELKNIQTLGDMAMRAEEESFSRRREAAMREVAGSTIEPMCTPCTCALCLCTLTTCACARCMPGRGRWRRCLSSAA